MFKVLLKKQLLELSETYTPKKQRGRGRRSLGFLILYAVLFLTLGLSMGMLFYETADGLTALGLDWLYFLVLMVLGLVIGVVGSVFSAYSSIYRAKDNEALLAMPIPPRTLLMARMTSVLFTGLLFELLVFLPGFVAYFLRAGFTFKVFMGCLTGFISVTLVCLALTCFFGWVVALISAHMRNRSFITVLVSLLLMAAYYVVYFRISGFLSELVQNAVTISERLSSNAYILKLFALGFTGEAEGMLLLLGIGLALMAITIAILVYSFDRIVTTEKGKKRAVYREGKASVRGAGNALLYKEARRFTQSPAYMLNCGLGLIIMLGALIYVLVRFNYYKQLVGSLGADYIGERFSGLLKIAPALIVSFISAMNPISAPSISLEGQSMWILRSLPVSAKQVISAKMRFHLMLVLPLSLALTLVLSFVAGSGALYLAANLAFVLGFEVALCALGLMLGLKHPSLDWTNEAVPVKRGMPISVTLLGGMALPMVLILPIVFIKGFDVAPYLWAVPCIIAVILVRWLYTKGTGRFDEIV